MCTLFTPSIFTPTVIFPMAQESSQGPLSGRSNRKLLQVQSTDLCSGFILLATNHLRFTHVAVGYLEGPLQIPYNLAWKCWTPVIVGCHMCICTILCVLNGCWSHENSSNLWQVLFLILLSVSPPSSPENPTGRTQSTGLHSTSSIYRMAWL